MGFLSKEESSERLVAAIRRAASGEIFFSAEQQERALRWREEVGRKWESLTKREREILGLLAQGLDNAAVAKTLGVRVRMVEQHITHLLDRLRVASRLEAAVGARDHLPEDLWKSTG